MDTRLYPPNENYTKSFPLICYLLYDEDEPISAVVNDNERYLEFTLNPKRIVYTYDAATSIKTTQDAGCYVESKGWAIRGKVNIEGNVGFVPAALRGTPSTATRADRSGFAFIQRLQRLYDLFFDRRRSNLYVDFVIGDVKQGKFYIVEPDRLVVSRDAGSPFGHTYSIPFTVIGYAERSENRYQSATITYTTSAKQAVSKNVDRLTELRGKANGFAGLIVGTLFVKSQLMLADLENVIGVFADLQSAVLRLSVEAPLGILHRASTSIQGMFDVLTGSDTVESVKWDINDFLIETDNIYSVLQTMYGKLFGSNVNTTDTSLFGKRGLANTNLTENTTALGSVYTAIADNTYNRSLLEDLQNTKMFKRYTVKAGDTLESISKTLYGSPHASEIIATRNNLKYPYIGEGSFLVAVGQTLRVPVLNTQDIDASMSLVQYNTYYGSIVQASTGTTCVVSETYPTDLLVGMSLFIGDNERVIISNTGNTLTLNINLNVAVGAVYRVLYKPYAVQRNLSDLDLLYGRDLLLRSYMENDVFYVDVVITQRRDFALVSGIANFSQAMLLHTTILKGSLPNRKRVGIGLSVGRTTNTVLTDFAIRQALLVDARVDACRVSSKVSGNIVSRMIYVKPQLANKEMTITL